MRHAKSSWNTDGLGDHARPLNSRGRRSATALGDWIRSKDLAVDQAYISTAQRTRETFAELKLGCESVYLDSLYHAGANDMREVLKNAQGETMLIVGHNPGIAWFARASLKVSPLHSRFDDYPTGATLVATFDLLDWKDVQPHQGVAADFVVPRELLED